MLELGAAVIADGLLDFTKRLLIRRVCHHARGNVILVRYADDIVAGFEYQADAKRFQAELRDRLARFTLTSAMTNDSSMLPVLCGNTQ